MNASLSPGKAALCLILFLLVCARATALAAEGELRLTTPRLGGQTITLLLPEPATSLPSAFYLLMPEFLSRISANAMIAEHAPGRGGATAWHRLQSRHDNGSQIAAITLPDFFLQSMLKEKRFNPDAISPFVILARAPLGLWIPEKHKAKNPHDFIDMVRDNRANFMAGTGSITGHHMATLMLNRAAGITFEYLPYLGTKEAARAVLANQATACWAVAGPASAMPGMRLLAVTSPVRSPLHPTVPTLMESSILVTFEQAFGLAMPATAPEAVIATASELYTRLATTPEFASRAAALGFTVDPVNLATLPPVVATQKKETSAFVNDYPINMTR